MLGHLNMAPQRIILFVSLKPMAREYSLSKDVNKAFLVLVRKKRNHLGWQLRCVSVSVGIARPTQLCGLCGIDTN